MILVHAYIFVVLVATMLLMTIMHIFKLSSDKNGKPIFAIIVSPVVICAFALFSWKHTIGIERSNLGCYFDQTPVEVSSTYVDRVTKEVVKSRQYNSCVINQEHPISKEPNTEIFKILFKQLARKPHEYSAYIK